jgi:hypothetical protein
MNRERPDAILAADGFDPSNATARDVMTPGIHCCSIGHMGSRVALEGFSDARKRS